MGASASHDYRFLTTWRVRGTAEEVSDVLADAKDLVRWWPDVYLRVEEIAPGDANGLGKSFSLLTKGALPYRLRWSFRVTASRRPHGFELEAWGDLAGTGVWTFREEGPEVVLTYDWRIRANKPILRYLSFLLKPLFSWNHRWAMARGEESLRRELARRQIQTPPV